MAAVEVQTILAWWGAGLSTLLAFVKLWELWRDRFRLDVSYSFSGNPDEGNAILIRNLAGRPLILSYWALSYCTRHFLRWECEDIAYAEHDAGDQKIEPHSTLELRFAQDEYFSWGHKALKGRRIYIRLCLAGRKPIRRLVYPE